MLMPAEALSFRMEMDDFTTQGVSHASHVVATAHALSGSLIAGFGALVLANHDLVFVVGSSGLSRSAAAISTLLFASVLVAQLDTFATFELLPALFGDGACNGTRRRTRMHANPCAGGRRHKTREVRPRPRG